MPAYTAYPVLLTAAASGHALASIFIVLAPFQQFQVVAKLADLRRDEARLSARPSWPPARESDAIRSEQRSVGAAKKTRDVSRGATVLPMDSQARRFSLWPDCLQRFLGSNGRVQSCRHMVPATGVHTNFGFAPTPRVGAAMKRKRSSRKQRSSVASKAAAVFEQQAPHAAEGSALFRMAWASPSGQSPRIVPPASPQRHQGRSTRSGRAAPRLPAPMRGGHPRVPQASGPARRPVVHPVRITRFRAIRTETLGNLTGHSAP